MHQPKSYQVKIKYTFKKKNSDYVEEKSFQVKFESDTWSFDTGEFVIMKDMKDIMAWKKFEIIGIIKWFCTRSGNHPYLTFNIFYWGLPNSRDQKNLEERQINRKK